jgi:hypothetical protein
VREVTSDLTLAGVPFGGGADVKVNRVLAVRLIQADWVYYCFSGDSESHNVRVSIGIVLRF